MNGGPVAQSGKSPRLIRQRVQVGVWDTGYAVVQIRPGPLLLRQTNVRSEAVTPGGHVVIKYAASEYSFLAHLRPGSVTVDPGQRVERGQQVGRCGHSGNSSEPHLHFQVQDHPDFATATSLPVRFDDIEIGSPGMTHEPDLVLGYVAVGVCEGTRLRAVSPEPVAP